MEPITTKSGLIAEALTRIKPNYLDDLNDNQKEAVLTLNGPLLMLAGAGTGKTRALTARIAHIIDTGSAKPNEILAVTFTNKAAREMKNRLRMYAGNVVENMSWLGTFHSLCAKLLRIHAELVNLKPNFTILDTDDQLRLLKQIIKAENIDEKKWPVRQIASIIDNWKNKSLTPAKVTDLESALYNGNAKKIYSLYQERLRILNATDFGDLLLHSLVIFQNNPSLLEKYQNKFRFILVDEYQDTNISQYLWLRLLAQRDKNLCCVGDDDQSIYGWRGAEVGNILKFENDFSGAKVIRLEQNYRSTPDILANASNLISANKNRLGKSLWTSTKISHKIRLIAHWDGEDEARWIGEEVEAYCHGTRGLEPVPLNKQAILVRASFQMRAFEDRFITIGLPYKVIGGPRFYERQEIRDAIAYFRICTTPEDSLALERIINVPKRGIGEKAMQTLNMCAHNENLSLLGSAHMAIKKGYLQTKTSLELSVLLNQIDKWRLEIKERRIPHYELAKIILDESGYTDMWQNEKSPTAPGRLENLKELVKALEEFENIEGFLEHISLMMENEQEDNIPKISIMTLHAAKGLEFSSVFLPGWEEGLFPSQRSLDENGQKALEEERRLAYVGITRAETHCNISFANNRRVYNQWQSSIPSRFIENLSKKHVEVLTSSGLYGTNLSNSNRYVDEKSSALVKNKSNFNSFHDKEHSMESYESSGIRRLKSEPTHISHYKIEKDSSLADIVFEPHEKVFHQKFGYGKVDQQEGRTVTVSFEKAGIKKVISDYLLNKDNLP